MTSATVIIIIIAAIVVLFIIPIIAMLFITLPIAKKQYTDSFVRTSPEKWARCNSCPENEEHTVMFNAGIRWADENRQFCKDVTITNDGLRLYGEFFDFGSKKSAVILSGRAESLQHAYYFAQPYKELGYNILVIDGRAHGLSEGKYNCVGIKESRDVEMWIDLLRKDFGSTQFVIHGICIGSSIAIRLAAKDIDGLKSVVVEGPYISFYNVIKQRTKNGGHPTFPVVEEMSLLLYFKTGVNIFTEKPIRYIKQSRIPVLFLCGREDISSLPKNCEKLYELCPHPQKEIVWFDHGAHSHLRIANTAEYDAAVKKFITKHEEDTNNV